MKPLCRLSGSGGNAPAGIPWLQFRLQPSSTRLQPSAFGLFLAKRAGFSLIEINIVLLVIGIGLVALLGLFPVGLRQAGLATSDSTSSMFADQVLSAIQGQTSTLTNWTDWVKFKASDVSIGGFTLATTANYTNATQFAKLDNYLGVPGSTIRYQLIITSVVDPLNFGGRLMRAAIRVSDRDQGDITQFPVYCTDFVFMGPAPR